MLPGQLPEVGAGGCSKPLFIGLAAGSTSLEPLNEVPSKFLFSPRSCDFSPSKSARTPRSQPGPASWRNCSTDLRPAKKRSPLSPWPSYKQAIAKGLPLAPGQRPDVFQPGQFIEVGPQLILAPLERLAQFAPAERDFVGGGLLLRGLASARNRTPAQATRGRAGRVRPATAQRARWPVRWQWRCRPGWFRCSRPAPASCLTGRCIW